jgi:hypothetical protein
LGRVGSPPARNHPNFSKQRHAPDTCVTRPHSSAPGAGGAPAGGAPAAGAAASPAPRSIRSIVGRLPWTTCARAASSVHGAAFVLCICGATCATEARPSRKAEHALDVHLLSCSLEQATWRSLRLNASAADRARPSDFNACMRGSRAHLQDAAAQRAAKREVRGQVAQRRQVGRRVERVRAPAQRRAERQPHCIRLHRRHPPGARTAFFPLFFVKFARGRRLRSAPCRRHAQSRGLPLENCEPLPFPCSKGGSFMARHQGFLRRLSCGAREKPASVRR